MSWARLAGTVHNQIIIIASHFKCQETGTVTATAERYTTAVAWEDVVKAGEGWSKRKRKSKRDCQACHNSRARVNAPFARETVLPYEQRKEVSLSLSLSVSVSLCLCIFCICMALGYCIYTCLYMDTHGLFSSRCAALRFRFVFLICAAFSDTCFKCSLCLIFDLLLLLLL